MILKMIVRASARGERFFRGLAAFVGIALYFVMHLLGLTIARPFWDNLSNSNFLVAFGVLAPAVFGGICAWAMNLFYRRDDVITVRLFVLVSMLLLVIFTDTYVQALSARLDVQRLLLPNLSFALGMGLYVLLRVKSEPTY